MNAKLSNPELHKEKFLEVVRADIPFALERMDMGDEDRHDFWFSLIQGQAECLFTTEAAARVFAAQHRFYIQPSF